MPFIRTLYYNWTDYMTYDINFDILNVFEDN